MGAKINDTAPIDCDRFRYCSTHPTVPGWMIFERLGLNQ